MNIHALTQNEKTIECYRKLRWVLDNENLRERQQRIYEILNTFNIDIEGTNMEKLLHNAGFKTK